MTTFYVGFFVCAIIAIGLNEKNGDKKPQIA
jgi:hypothetical protein